MPARLLRRLWCAVGAAGLFMTTACAEGAQRPDYDAWHQAVSALSLGPGGWIQMLNFLVFGAIVLSTVPVWRQILVGGRGAAAFPALRHSLVRASFCVGAFRKIRHPATIPQVSSHLCPRRLD